MEAACGLLELPPDALAHALAFLEARDVASLERTCWSLRSSIAGQVGCHRRRRPPQPARALPACSPSTPPARALPARSPSMAAFPCTHSLHAPPQPTHLQDALWRHQCSTWLVNHPGAPSAPAALAQLRLSSYRLLLQALHRLGSWPAGPVWFAVSASVMPRGRLLVIDPTEGGFRLATPRGATLAGPAPPAEAWQLAPNPLVLRAEVDASGTQVGLGSSCGGAAMAAGQHWPAQPGQQPGGLCCTAPHWHSSAAMPCPN